MFLGLSVAMATVSVVMEDGKIPEEEERKDNEDTSMTASYEIMFTRDKS